MLRQGGLELARSHLRSAALHLNTAEKMLNLLPAQQPQVLHLRDLLQALYCLELLLIPRQELQP